MKLCYKKDLLYRAYVFLLILMLMLESTSWMGFNDSSLRTVIQILALFFVLLYIIKSKYSTKELIALFALNCVGLLCYISSGMSGLLMTMLAITLLPQGTLDDVLNMVYKEELFLFVTIILCSFLGILDNDGIAVNKGAYIANAFSLGFAHPNMLAAQATSIVLLFLCVNRRNLKRTHYFISLVSIFLIFCVSKGRTALLLGMLSWILIVMREKQIVKKLINKILPWIYMIVLVSLFLCMLVYAKFGHDAKITLFLNDTLFNGRIGLAFRSLLAYPITLFGRAIDLSAWNEYQYFSLDNGQIMILLEYGVVGFISYFWVFQKTARQIKTEQETVLGIIVITFIIWSMYEGTMYFLGKNFALLFLETRRRENSTNRSRKKDLSFLKDI